MKKLLVYLLLYNGYVLAQNSAIQVNYKVSIKNEEETFNNHAQLRAYFEYSIKNSWKLNFVLKVEQKGSSFLFQPNDLFDKNNLNDKIMLDFAGNLGPIYCLNDSVYSNINFLGKNIYQQSAKIIDWKLHEDTKKIDGYLCYKATNVYKVEYGEKVFNHPVVAWFCPELPYQYGPNGYGNLPGLILELQVRNVVFGADKIEFTNIEPIDFSFLNDAKFYSPEKIDKLATDFRPD